MALHLLAVHLAIVFATAVLVLALPMPTRDEER